MSILRIGRRSILAAGLLCSGRAFGQARANSTPRPRVRIETGRGTIVVELEQDKAPLTAGNFLRYVDSGRFDGSTFYRALRTGAAGVTGLIEGGLQNDPQKLLPPIAHESTLVTGLRHIDGTLSMARAAVGTATADFFICIGPAAYLDADPNAPGDNAGYAAFGQVVEGMNVVRSILASPTGGVARNPVMKGQILDPPVPIVSMKRA